MRTGNVHTAGASGRLAVPLKSLKREFPGGPVVKTSPSSTGGSGSTPGWGTKIPHALRPKKPKHKIEAILLTNSIKT